jgi:hypothetical protein
MSVTFRPASPVTTVPRLASAAGYGLDAAFMLLGRNAA